MKINHVSNESGRPRRSSAVSSKPAPKQKPRTKFMTRGLSHTEDDIPLILWGEERAKHMRQSFSAYVMCLIEADRDFNLLGRALAPATRDTGTGLDNLSGKHIKAA